MRERTICLIPHASKIPTKIVQGGIDHEVEEVLVDQFGFRNNKGTRETILALRLITENIMGECETA